MTDVAITKAELEAGQLPLVCVATGEAVEELTSIPLGATKVAQVAGLPSGLINKNLQKQLTGSVLNARIGRSDGVKSKQMAVLGVRALFGLIFAWRLFASVTSGALVGAVLMLLGIVLVVGLGGAYINRAVSVGVNSTEVGTTISGAHADFVAALEQIRSGEVNAPAAAVAAQQGRPVVAPGLY